MTGKILIWHRSKREVPVVIRVQVTVNKVNVRARQQMGREVQQS